MTHLGHFLLCYNYLRDSSHVHAMDYQRQRQGTTRSPQLLSNSSPPIRRRSNASLLSSNMDMTELDSSIVLTQAKQDPEPIPKVLEINNLVVSSVVTSTITSIPSTSSFSTQTLPLDAPAAALLLSQQNAITAKETEYQHKTPTLIVKDNNVTPPKKNTSDNSRRRRTRCKKCDACVRADCGQCHFCKDMKKFGGAGRMKQSCITRQCMSPVLPHTACCMICGRDGWEKFTCNPILGVLDESMSSLMECSSCWEIVHPVCLKEKDPSINLDTGKKDDLPNSWECPKCILSKGNKTPMSKPLKTPSIVTKKDVAIAKPDQESILKVPSNDPETSSEEELPPDDYDTFSHDQELAFTPNGSTTIDKSSARFPLLQEAIRQQHLKSKTIPSNVAQVKVEPVLPTSSLNNPKPVPTSSASPIVKVNKKGNDTLKDRLFRSLKSLKRSSDSSKSPSLSLKKPKKKLENVTKACGTDLVNPKVKMVSKVVPNVEKPCLQNSSPIKREKQIEEKPEIKIDLKPMIKETKLVPLQSGIGLHGLPLVMPKFVVRPAPLPEDCSESEDDEDKESKEEQNDENDENAAESSEESESERAVIMRKRLRKFRRPKKENLSLERDVILPVLPYLSRKDVIQCAYVCKLWNRWSTSPQLWQTIELSGAKISANVLIGLVRRQPVNLDLSWTNISYKQLSWLLPRLPLMRKLNLSGCSASCISALASANCPLLKSLNISWIDALDDDLVKELLIPPIDSRPGLLETKTRLRQLDELSVCGADISDFSVRLISSNLPLLTKLDLGNCQKITDVSIAFVGSSRAQKMNSILLYSCENLTDKCFEVLKKCRNLTHLDVRKCGKISKSAVNKFFDSQLLRHDLKLIQGKLILPNRS